MRARDSHRWKSVSAFILGIALLAASPDGAGWSGSPVQVNTLDRNDVGASYNSFYQPARLVPHGWTGSADGCVPGDTSAAFKQAQISQINWNRAVAGVPAQVQFDSANLSGEQQLGVMLAVNRMLSHTPPMNWLCYTAAGAEAAGKSNITLSLKSGPDDGTLPSPGFVSGFMQDGGDSNIDVGHRRWLVHPPTTQMTIGMGQARGNDGFLATGGAIRVVYPTTFDPWPPTRWGYVAWPAPGFVPWQEAPGRWSIIVEKADFSAATVRVSYGSTIVPTHIISASGPSGPFFGGPALVWEFTGVAGGAFNPLAPTANFAFLKPDRDTTYVVHVDNVNVQGQGMRSFEYTVVVFDPATHEADFNALFENGWWWNSAQGGRGFFFEKQGNLLFIAAYLYADDGQERWLAALCVLDSATSCSGPLNEYFGGQTLGGAYKSPMVTTVGQVRLTFTSRTTATLEWPGGTLQLERLVFGANRFDGTTTGWWWYDVESGTGWGFEIQGTTFVIVGYFYDPDGRPVWYLGAGPVNGGNVLSGTLQRYSGGQTLTGPYHPPNAPTNVGPFTLQLTGPDTANFQVAGRQITLKRFLFGR
jgi:hypothetical protein